MYLIEEQGNNLIVKLIQADRYDLKDTLKEFHFDVIVDTAYNADDVTKLLDAVDSFKDYILISSSAVYPEYEPQPFKEDGILAVNKYWGKYGTDKKEAEKVLLEKVLNAYVVRPPYLYGPMNNVYREAFVFECALDNRKFYLPKDGEMKLQFFHVDDLCRFIEILLDKQPEQHIFNVGNKEAITIKEWVKLCYEVVGTDIEQRNYFSFYNYECYLDVSKQYELMSDIKPLEVGLKEAYDWYINNADLVVKKPLLEYIDKNFCD